MSQILSDVRFASRTLRAKPAFALVALASLALGIGANTAIFSIVESALLRGLPFKDSDRLVYIGDHQPCCESVSLSAGEYLDYRHQTRTFEDLAAYTGQSLTLTGGENAEDLTGRVVTTNFFEVLGAHAERGRLISSRIDVPGPNERVAVISNGLWKTRFGSDETVIGRDLTLNGSAFKVIGVLAPHEEYPADAQVWISPRGAVPEFREDVNFLANTGAMYGTHWLTVVGRLKPGVHLPTARAEMRTIAARIDAAHDEPNHWAVLVPLQGLLVRNVRPALALLGTAVVVILLIACANTAGLMLARGAGRTRELSIRIAIGAGRWEVTRLLLVESLLLAAAGGICGACVAYVALHLLHLYSPYHLPPALAPALNAPVLAFCLLASIVAALITGVGPSLNAAHVDINEGLKESSKGTAGIAVQRLRRILVGGEIALSVLLLAGALLLIRSFSKLIDVDPGFHPSQVMTAQLSLPPSHYVTAEKTRQFWNDLLAKVQLLPGLDSAALASDIPLNGVNMGSEFEVQGHPAGPKQKVAYSNEIFVSPGLVGTLGIPLLNGRDFTSRDQAGSAHVVLVNQTLVRRFFPHEDAIGKHIRIGSSGPWDTIVGVVGNVKWESLDAEATLDTYRPMAQSQIISAAVVARTRAGVQLQLGDLQSVVRSLDRDVPVSDFKPAASYLDHSIERQRFLLALLGSFSGIAILLSAVGLYAVLAYSVQQRRREIGVRLAVGATQANVLSMVLRDALAITAVGVGIGILAAFWSSALLKSMLFGITDTDIVSYIGSVLLIVSVAIAASLVPAIRAARVDPVSALRYE